MSKHIHVCVYFSFPHNQLNYLLITAIYVVAFKISHNFGYIFC